MAVIKALVLPPGLHLLLALVGFVLLLRWRRTGSILIAVSLISLYLLSTVPVVRALLAGLEVHPPLARVDASDMPGAIVVLGAGRYPRAPEYGGDTVNSSALERLRYAVTLRDRTELPILVTGGVQKDGQIPEAEIMARVLETTFAADVEWLETESRNTAENAEYSARILDEAGINRIYLVTHAAHMPRSVWAFERAGLEVTPAPTVYGVYELDHAEPPWFIPSMEALMWGYIALHEYLGLWWYRIRY